MSAFGSGEQRGITVALLPFGRNTNVAVGLDRFVGATTDSYELRIPAQTKETEQKAGFPDRLADPAAHQQALQESGSRTRHGE